MSCSERGSIAVLDPLRCSGSAPGDVGASLLADVPLDLFRHKLPGVVLPLDGGPTIAWRQYYAQEGLGQASES